MADSAEQQSQSKLRTTESAFGGEPKQPEEPKRLMDRLFPDSLRKILKNPLGLLGTVLLILFVIVAIAAPWLAPPENPERPYQMTQDGYGSRPKPPNPDAWSSFPPKWEQHPLGTAANQYDIYYGLIWGTRTAFQFAVSIVGLAVIIGVTMGTLAGYFGGWIDDLIMRIVDVIYGFPNLLLPIVLLTTLGSVLPSQIVLIIALVAFGWINYARLLRGDILTVKNQEYVTATRSLGASNLRIMWKHVLPNAIHPVFVLATLNFGSVMVTIATLSFFGIGLPLGYADWGQLVSFSREWIIGIQGDNPLLYWYTFVPPAVAITLFVLSFNLIGDAVRDVMDPRQKV